MPEGCHPDASLRPLTVKSVTPLHVQLLRPSSTGRGRPAPGEALASAAVAWFSPERLSCWPRGGWLAPFLRTYPNEEASANG
jgi:hypothetical protein